MYNAFVLFGFLDMQTLDYDALITSILNFRQTLKDKHLWKVQERLKYLNSLKEQNDDDFLSLVYNIQNTLKINLDKTITLLTQNVKIKNCCICGKRYFLLTKHAKTCSKECSKTLRKQTNFEKYGSEYVGQVQEFKDKIKETNLERYGVEHPAQNQDVMKKTIETNLERYGCKSTFQNKEVQEKYKQTCLERYGVKNTMQDTNVKTAWKERFKEKYNVENPSQVFEIQAKKHEKLKTDFLKGLNDKNISNFDDLNVDFLRKFVKIIDNQEYFDLLECAEYFKIDTRTVYKVKNYFGFNIPNYFTRSDDERELFNWIPCNNKVSNDRKLINPLELDIVLPDYNLAIEYDGVYWHSDEYKDQNYHLNKTLECNNKGIQLFHIFDTDDIDIWKSMISNKLKLNTKVYARKCIVKEITNFVAKSFCAQNHLQGACNAKINLGLFYNDELLEVMTFGKPRYNKHYEFELLRLCTKKYYSVIGGASKLWKCFCQKYSPKSVISYANRRFSNGNIYETLGFKKLTESKPNYWYVKGGELFSRLKFQKHKLKDILENYDENLSEYENMQLNNYHRIFDCGNLVYTINF